MLRDVAGDAEAATLNGVDVIEAYRCHRAVAKILQHIAMDVRIWDAQPVTQAPYLALTSDSCTDKSAKKEELMYSRFPQGSKINTQFFPLQRPPSPAQSAPKILPFVSQFFSIFLPL